MESQGCAVDCKGISKCKIKFCEANYTCVAGIYTESKKLFICKFFYLLKKKTVSCLYKNFSIIKTKEKKGNFFKQIKMKI